MAKFLHDHMWSDSILAIKLSCTFSDFEAFYDKLIEKLPQTSEETRKRGAGTIVRRFFPERTLNQPTRLTWLTYKDESLLQHLMRYQFLVSEPVIADFAKLQVLNREPGDRLEFGELADSFVQETYGEVKPKLRQRLSAALQATGLVTRSQQVMYVRELPDLKRAFGVLLHVLFAPQPTTIAVQDILNHVFWRYLGLRDPTDVVKVLRYLEAKKIIVKYVRADQLEQVTTAYSADEILNYKRLS
ncbi:hypothetical protein NG798_25140 [Ancylothrix sp. C2]|uniref:hypothetical protein n=1 Tax=Ancylothrix sp. D3o TaxID=2953691 RepID=UPI0021BBA07A|nr:hypothetical protein [Ancylothrix sp. D3o]MCT7953087.1 hypothetical protein [Ancylothrix sp. D3o]